MTKIIGIDEVGRGCWAGPLLAAAVRLSDDDWSFLNDSKKLSKIKREKFSKLILSSDSRVGVGWVWPAEINQFGLKKSVQLAMERAVSEIEINSDDEIIVDGNINYLEDLVFKDGCCYKIRPCIRCEVKADGSVSAVSAASIVAKVARDNYMAKIAPKYPGYQFEKHVGYGTKLHYAALLEYGVSDQHRINYKPIQQLANNNSAIV